MTKIFAHRGASGYAPENTIKAFLMAAEQGADGIELDVQLTRDGEVVVVHDESLDRVTGIHGYVRDYNLQELKAISFDNHMEEYKGIQIPTLKEVLECMKPLGLEVNIELKTGIFWYPEIEEKTAEIVRQAEMETKVIYSSFNHYSVQKIRKIQPQAKTAYLYSDVFLNIEKYAQDTGVDGIHPAVYHMKMADFAEKYKNSQLKVRVWTVNDEKDMERFISEGYEAIITNYPDKGIRVRNGIEKC